MKPRSIFSILGAFIIASFVMFGWGHVASALTVTPPLSELQLVPGETTKTKIKLYNETQNPVTLYAEAVNFSAAGETGNPTYDFTAEKIGLSTWINVTPDPIHIEAGNSAEVPVTINTPADAEPGGHYAVVFFSENPPADGSQVSIGTKVGTLYLAEVAGDITESGQIVEFLTGASTYSRLPVDFIVRFKNTGSVHLRPTGEITVKNIFGKISDTTHVNVTKSATLPDQIRKYEAEWTKNVIDESTATGMRAFWQEYKNEMHNFAFGRYSATAVMTAQATIAVQDTATTQFWVIPWHILLVDGFVLIIFVLLLILIIKKYNSWIISKAGGSTSNRDSSVKGK
ncbi:MAG: hypothetical protein WC495_04390 [Patescibacteria group bacterium]|jgi:hypothetical protein